MNGLGRDAPATFSKADATKRRAWSRSGVEWGGALDARPGRKLMTPPFQAVVKMLKM